MAHKTVEVMPRDDGQDYQQSWMVHVSGKMKSNHTTKEAAKNAARRYASDGDTLVLHRTDGTIQDRKTVRDATASSDSNQSDKHSPVGMGTFDTALGFDK